MTWIVALALASLLFWLGLTADRRRAWPGERLLREDPPKAHVEVSEPVVAIVPARNEAEVLPRTLPALLAQEGIDLQVILVDDGSNDGTAVRAVALARENGFEDRLQVLQAGSRPPEWSGKIHALHCGYQYLLSQGRESLRWILFTDADIEHRPGSVRDLLDRAVEGDETGSWDLVSVMARLRADDFWEKLMIPAFVFFFQLLYPFRRVADPGSSVAAAAGGCVLISRQVLEHTGGLPVIAEEIIDDVALGRAVKRAGGRVWLGFDPGIVSVRPYTDLRALWQMVSRTAFTQLGYRVDLLLATLVALGVFLVAPPIWVLLAGLMYGTSGGGGIENWLWPMVWSLMSWMLMTWAYWPAVRYHRLAAPWAATLPVASLFFGLMTAGSALDYWRGRGATWRGRRYRGSGDSTSPPQR